MTKKGQQANLAKGFGRASGAPQRPKKDNTAMVKSKKAACEAICGAVCGMVDPFCESACGCKLMDDADSRTFSYTSKSRVTVTTDANGRSAKFITPSVDDYASGGTLTGSVVSSWAAPANLPETASIRDAAVGYRVVSAGVRIYSSVAADKAAGIVMVTTMPKDPNNIGPPAGFDISSLSYEEVTSDSLYGFDKSFVFSSLGTSKRKFISTAASTEANPFWNGIVVAVDGAEVSTTVLHCEVTIHLELQPAILTLYARLADPPANHIPQVAAIADKVSNELAESYPRQSASQQIRDHVWREVTNFASSLSVGDLIGVALSLI